MRLLSLSNTRRAYQMPHLTTKFIVFVVRILELSASYMGRKVPV